MKKKITSILLVACMTLTLAGCSTSTTTQTNQSKETAAETLPKNESGSKNEVKGNQGGFAYDPADFVSEKDPSQYKIAVLIKGTAEWFDRLELGVKKFSEDYGVNAVMIEPANPDAASQLEMLDSLLTQDYDAICVVPNDSSALETSLKGALDKKVVVIGHEASDLVNCLYDTEAFNAEQYGSAIAEQLAQAMGKSGVYGDMVGFTTSINHMQYSEAELAYMKKNYPDITVVNDTLPTCESQETVTTAYEQAKQVLKSNPEVTGFIGHASGDGLGIAQAVEELGLAGKVHIVCGGTPNMYIDYLEKGTVDCVSVWDPMISGYVMCQAAYNVLSGVEIGDGADLSGKAGFAEGYEKVTQVDGANRCLIGNAPITATKENAREFGF